jgi:hypothetical protein
MSETEDVATNYRPSTHRSALLVFEVLMMSVKSALTKKPTRNTLGPVVLGSLAAVLAIIFDHGCCIHGLPRLAFLVAGSAFWRPIFANCNGR